MSEGEPDIPERESGVSKAFRCKSNPEGMKELRQGWSAAKPLQPMPPFENPEGVTDKKVKILSTSESVAKRTMRHVNNAFRT